MLHDSVHAANTINDAKFRNSLSGCGIPTLLRLSGVSPLTSIDQPVFSTRYPACPCKVQKQGDVFSFCVNFKWRSLVLSATFQITGCQVHTFAPTPTRTKKKEERNCNRQIEPDLDRVSKEAVTVHSVCALPFHRDVLVPCASVLAFCAHHWLALSNMQFGPVGARHPGIEIESVPERSLPYRPQDQHNTWRSSVSSLFSFFELKKTHLVDSSASRRYEENLLVNLWAILFSH